MNMKKITITINLFSLFLIACNSSNNEATGYGNFEATEITISAENMGKLVAFDLKEGQVLDNGAIIGYIDTIQLSIKKAQLGASKTIIHSKSKGVLSQISVLEAKLNTLSIQKQRLTHSQQQTS